jgi:hypothetical protein
MTRRRLAAAAAFVALAAASIAVRRLWPTPAALYVDNGTEQDVVVSRDGAEVAKVPRGGLRKLDLPTGGHRLTATAGGRTVDEQRLEAHRGQRWVWSVAGRNRWAVYTMTYGQDAPAPAPREVGAGQRLFAVPDDVDADPGQALPPTVTAQHGTRTATARGLYHFPLHTHRPCCMAIVKQAGHNEQDAVGRE